MSGITGRRHKLRRRQEQLAQCRYLLKMQAYIVYTTRLVAVIHHRTLLLQRMQVYELQAATGVAVFFSVNESSTIFVFDLRQQIPHFHTSTDCCARVEVHPRSCPGVLE